MPPSPLVKVDNLQKEFAATAVVRGVSFELHRGQIMGFLGPNGAGKSTTMGMLAGVLTPNAGVVRIDGMDMRTHPKACKSRLGYLPEHPPLYPELQVDEYLTFCASLRGVARSARGSAVGSAKERCGLTEVGKQLIGQLSKGYQQRVGIAQAIVHSPDLIILDEPTVGLDPIQIRLIRDLIRNLGREYGVILSTHILAEVRSVCDHVQIIAGGQLVFSESIADLQKHSHGETFRVTFSSPPTPELLTQISGIYSVESLDADSFHIRCDPTPGVRERLVDTAVAQRWGLYELSPGGDPLEELFVSVATGEHSSDIATR